jgi:hypothetical protein
LVANKHLCPCTVEGKFAFLNWLKNISMPDDTKWLIVGDFNLLRSPENRNKGGNLLEMLGFNDARLKISGAAPERMQIHLDKQATEPPLRKT